jgi:hypothetical protein
MKDSTSQQIREAFLSIDEQQGSIDIDSLRERRVEDRPTRLSSPIGDRGRRRWSIASAAAAAALLIVGIPLGLGLLDGDEVTETSAATTTVVDTTVAPATTAAPTTLAPVEGDPAGPIEWVTYPKDGVTAPGPYALLRQGDGQFLAYEGSLVWTDGEFIEPDDDPRTLLWTSADGLDWTSHHLEQFDGTYTILVGEVDGRYLLNVDASDEAGNQPSMWMSTDLVTWEPFEGGEWGYWLHATDERIHFAYPTTVYDRGWTNPQTAEGEGVVLGATRERFYARFQQGEDGVGLFSSTDGIEWTFEVDAGSAGIHAFAASTDSVLVWLDQDGDNVREFWLSQDGGEFVQMPGPPTMSDRVDFPDINIAATDSHFIVTWAAVRAWVTTDGTDWTPAESPVAFWNPGTPSVGNIVLIPPGPFEYVLATDEQAVWMRGVVSPAAPTTTFAPVEGDPVGPTVEWVTYPMDGVTAPGPTALLLQGDGQFLAYESSVLNGSWDDKPGDSRTLLWTSDDGLEWTSHHLAAFDGMYTRFAGVADGRYLLWASGTTADGATWSGDEGLLGCVWSTDLVNWQQVDPDGSGNPVFCSGVLVTDDRILLDLRFREAGSVVFERGWTNQETVEIDSRLQPWFLDATSDRFYAQIWYGPDGPMIFSSVDGVEWTAEVDSGAQLAVMGNFAAARDDVLLWDGRAFWLSEDGEEFRVVSPPLMPGASDRVRIVAADGHFVVTWAGRRTWVTADGIEWEVLDEPLPDYDTAAAVRDVVLIKVSQWTEVGVRFGFASRASDVWMRGVVSP